MLLMILWKQEKNFIRFSISVLFQYQNFNPFYCHCLLNVQFISAFLDVLRRWSHEFLRLYAGVNLRVFAW